MIRTYIAGVSRVLFILMIWNSVEAADSKNPRHPGTTERAQVFSFTQKPTARYLGDDRYEISFGVKGYCDVTVGVVDEKGAVVRHLGSGVLGQNVPLPFQKSQLKQKLYWDGKDDLGLYPKHPEKLRVRVMLGLKPVFEKRLGGTSPKSLPGFVGGIAIGPDGAYVYSKGLAGAFGHGTIRKFDRDGKYQATVMPPPAGLPQSKLKGMGYLEYEPGKRDLHAARLNATISHGAHYLDPLDGDNLNSCQLAVAGTRLVFTNQGFIYASPGSYLHYVHTDGTTDARGIGGLTFIKGKKDYKGKLGGEYAHQDPRLAVSPDGKRVFVANVKTGKGRGPASCVFVRELDGDKPAKAFAGDLLKTGTDNKHFSDAAGVDCDGKGRVYISDTRNHRVQIYSPEGQWLKTIRIDRPELICVHKKTGGIYILHTARVRGKSVTRMTKLISMDNPKEAFHLDGVSGLMALDSWSSKPRLWFSGALGQRIGHAESTGTKLLGSGSVTIWEEHGHTLKKIVDFEADARKQAGKSWRGNWNGEGSHNLGVGGRTVCDPLREKLYYKDARFDLETGAAEIRWRTKSGGADDYAFDKRGYMHGHQNNRAGTPCIWRVDPTRVTGATDKAGDIFELNECPYNYGVERPTGGWLGKSWTGALATKCQAGAKGFQDGMGVNMKGDIAVASNIYYVPKMDDLGREQAMAGSAALTSGGRYNEEGLRYSSFLRSVQDALKKGDQVYFVKRQAGVPLAGATVWLFDATGELKSTTPAVLGGLVNGTSLDEDGFVYLTMRQTRMVGGKKFLTEAGGIIGEAKTQTPFTGTYVKGHPAKLKMLLKHPKIPMDTPPQRPLDVAKGWVEGADWLYAGASPIVSGGCSCPQMRAHLDWYKRSFVPEAYRHSIGILDANGNLIVHLGEYGNFDSAPGGKDGARPGAGGIRMGMPRYLSGTDKRLCYEDWGDRLVVLKLDYEAEETVGIKMK